MTSTLDDQIRRLVVDIVDTSPPPPGYDMVDSRRPDPLPEQTHRRHPPRTVLLIGVGIVVCAVVAAGLVISRGSGSGRQVSTRPAQPVTTPCTKVAGPGCATVTVLHSQTPGFTWKLVASSPQANRVCFGVGAAARPSYRASSDAPMICVDIPNASSPVGFSVGAPLSRPRSPALVISGIARPDVGAVEIIDDGSTGPTTRPSHLLRLTPVQNRAFPGVRFFAGAPPASWRPTRLAVIDTSGHEIKSFGLGILPNQIRIAVINASNRSAAASADVTVADQYGYTVVGTGTTAQIQQGTTIACRPIPPFLPFAPIVQRAFGGTIVPFPNGLPPTATKADCVVLVGN
jgi:hypothetical protein